jgi:hypothetical protein
MFRSLLTWTNDIADQEHQENRAFATGKRAGTCDLKNQCYINNRDFSRAKIGAASQDIGRPHANIDRHLPAAGQQIVEFARLVTRPLVRGWQPDRSPDLYRQTEYSA